MRTIRVCRRLEGPWLVLYIAPDDNQDPRVAGREVARVHIELLTDDQDKFEPAMVAFMRAIGRSAHRKLGLGIPDEYIEEKPREPQA
jgi:hypothetical protein